MRVRPGEKVVVKWLDAFGHCAAWAEDVDAYRGGRFRVETVGYYLGVKKGYLRLCGDWARGCKGRVFAIPSGMILKIKKI